MLGPAARAGCDERQKRTEFQELDVRRGMIGVAEEFEECGGEERVGEFEGVAAGAAQPVRLLYLSRDPPLLRQGGQRNLDGLQESLGDALLARRAGHVDRRELA